MNTQQPTQIAAPSPESSDTNKTVGKKAFFNSLWAKVPQGLKTKLNNFYSNKKIFIPVVGAFGLIFLVIVVGVLFGSNGTPKENSQHVSTPRAQATPVQNTADALTLIQIGLARLKDQILTLDVKQSRLQPPPINFDIKF